MTDLGGGQDQADLQLSAAIESCRAHHSSLDRPLGGRMARLDEHRALHRGGQDAARVRRRPRQLADQVFDENRKFLDASPDIRRPYYIYMSADQHLWIADDRTQKFTTFNLHGELLYWWGTFGAFPGGVWGVHQRARVRHQLMRARASRERTARRVTSTPGTCVMAEALRLFTLLVATG